MKTLMCQRSTLCSYRSLIGNARIKVYGSSFGIANCNLPVLIENIPVVKYDSPKVSKIPRYTSFYMEADRIRHKEQDHGRCMCPYRFIWRCDGDCLDCEYHVAGDITSLDQPLSDGNGTLGDYMPDRSKSMEEIISDRMLLEQLFARLRELDPDADTIIQCWLDDYKISDRAIAEKLGRKQRTFADQMKKIRTELRKIRGY